MTTSQVIRILENLVAKGETERALSITLKFIKPLSRRLHRQCVLLCNRQGRLHRDLRDGVLDDEKRQLLERQISASALSLFDAMEEELPPTLDPKHVQIISLITGIPPELTGEANAASSSPSPRANKRNQLVKILPRTPFQRAAGWIAVLVLVLSGPTAIFLLRRAAPPQEAAMAAAAPEVEIGQLARSYGLYNIPPPNEHLNWRPTETALWLNRYRAGKPIADIEREFARFQQILDEAHQNQREILSWEDVRLLARQP